MGRTIPAHNNNLPFIHPLLQLSFLAATLAASIAIITALCGVRSRKKSSSRRSSFTSTTKHSTHTSASASSSEPEKSQYDDDDDDDDGETQIKELPLPPALREAKSPIQMKKATSERRLSFSLSIKVPRSLSVAKSSDPKQDERKKDTLKTEESVWMKTIILGDKCVPDEEEDAVIYEGKGKKISAYHPKHHNSLSFSRQSSLIDPNSLSHSDPNLQKKHPSM